ncbi:transcriptional activator RinB [Staphylococcus xylosus]|nr:transcriptional activator RinB [Staphylococcus xylosus]
MLKTLLIIGLYELSKYVTNQILIKLEANDVVDTPCDYDKDVK